MPYAPGVQDISGQLRANGILGAAQAYGQGMNSLADSFQQFQQNETMRRQATGTAIGKIANNPYLQAQLQKSPDVQALFDKVSGGKSNMKDVQQLAGWAAGAEDAQKQMAAQQQMQLTQQQLAAQQFALQEAQTKKSEEDAQKAKFAQYLGLGQAPAAPNPMMLGQMPQDVGPAPGAAPQGAAPAPQLDPLTAQALAYFKATGRVPGAPEMSNMMGDQSRQAVEQTRAQAQQQIRDMADQTRSQIEAAKRETDQAKIDAKNAPPVFTQHPETGIWMMTQNGQTQAIPGQIAKDPHLAEIDALEKSGDISHADAVAEKKKIIHKAATYSPNGLAQLLPLLQQAQGGPAAAAPAATAGDPGFGAAPAPASPYATPNDLISAVRAGQISATAAKAIAAQKGWQ